jgi:hypothetical protein
MKNDQGKIAAKSKNQVSFKRIPLAFKNIGRSDPFPPSRSALLSGGLEALFYAVGRFMNSSAGMATAATIVLLLFLFKPRWISKLI